MKKLLALAMVFCMALVGTATASAAEVPPNGDNQTSAVTIQKINTVNFKEAEKESSQNFLKINSENFSFPKLDSKSDNAKNPAKTNGIWQIVDPVFVGNGNLTTSTDLYLVQTTSSTTAFLKLASSNSALISALYIVNSDGSLSPTGFGVYANGSDNYGVLAAGNYAIAIGSSNGNARGSYTLMWNCSNPSGASAIVDKTSDLSRVVLFYSNDSILSNGNNIMTDLKWEEHETWYTDYGYSGRDMIIDTITSKGTYLGSFTSSAPYSTNRALFIDVSRGSYLYFNSYYQNINGSVTHIMNYFDPSGLETPRWLGDAPTDSAWGSHYIVIDLNTFKVIDFLSPFNYHYTQDGGRTYSLGNITRIG